MRALALVPILLMIGACSSNEAAENAMNVDETIETGVNAADEVTAAPTIFCPIIEDRATQDECDDFNALNADVRPGPSALDIPQKMVRGRAYTVTLVIDRPLAEAPPPPPPPPTEDMSANAVDEVSDENVVDTVTDENAVAEYAVEPGETPPSANEVVANLPGADVAFQARVGRYMSAELEGLGFAIRPLSPQDPLQEVPRGGQGRWEWEVIPQKGGELQLTVKTQAFGIVNGKRKALGGASTSKSVDVKVSWGDRLRDLLGGIPGWIALITAILAAVGGALAAWLKIRKSWRDRDK